MTTNTLDRAGRAAAADLHARTRAVDTDAALAALAALGTIDARGGGGLRPGRRRRLGRPGRPVFVGAAAAVLVVAAVAGVLAARSTDDAATIESGPAAPMAARDFGPVQATIRGVESPTLRADLHAPELLGDGTEVAVAISGARPGVRYALGAPCAYGDPNFNPAANCDNGGAGRGSQSEDVVGPDGTALLVARVWAVFDGRSMHRLNDCRVTACALVVGVVTEDDQLDDPPPAIRFAGPSASGEQLELRFDPATPAPPLPVVELDVVRRDGDAVVVRLTGRHLEPGPSRLLLDGSTTPRTGVLTYAGGEVDAPGTAVTVAADGTLDQEVALPLEIVQDASLGETVPPRPPVRCDAPEATCQVSVVPEDDGRPVPERRLLPNRVPYPDLP